MELHKKKCVPCEGGVAPMTMEEVTKMLRHINGWSSSGRMITKVYQFSGPEEALDFLQRSGRVANEEDHHPDAVWSYKKIVITFSTHAIKGLSENDFIMAAKFDEVYDKMK